VIPRLSRILVNDDARRWLGVIVSILIAILALSALISRADYDQLLAASRQISLPILGLALTCYGATWIFRTWRLGLLLRIDPYHLPWWSLYRVQIAGFAVNAVLPAKLGEVALIAFLRSSGIRGSCALAAVFQARLFDVLALMTIMIGSGITLLGNSSIPWRWSILSGVLFLVLLPMILVILDRQFRLEKWLAAWQQKKVRGRLQRFLGKVSDTLKAYRAIVANRWLFCFSFFQSVLLWIGEVMVAILVALAVGIPHSYLPWLFLAVPLANVGKAFPITPGGIGIYEGLMAATLHSAGLSWEFAVVVGIVDHILKKSWVVVWGAPMVFHQVRSFGRIWLSRDGV